MNLNGWSIINYVKKVSIWTGLLSSAFENNSVCIVLFACMVLSVSVGISV